MQYKIVTLQEKTVAGLSARTNNLSPQMGEVIGGLWKSFYGEDCYPAVKNKVGGSSFGIYTDYDDDEKGDYTVLAACEISAVDGLPEGVVVRKIPSGKYAEFSITGEMDTQAQLAEINRLWQEIWKMKLDRSFVCDFEEYRSADPKNADVRVYVGLN